MSTAVHELLREGGVPESLPVAGNFPVDVNVAAKFSEGTRILSADRHGTSAWTVTARLVLELPSGKQERYFLKCASEDAGRRLMEGEFHAMSELYKVMPSMVPRPHAWGRYAAQNPETYFFLQEYVDMHDSVPDADQLCTKLAQLHRSSVSPTGKFGFQVNTCQGRIQQNVGWEHSWTTLFEKMLGHVMNLDFEINGYWEELDILERRIVVHVIPRLIGALERDGRSIKPSLIHADLWEGNTGTSIETGDIYIFDAAAFYAHNEMEIGEASQVWIWLANSSASMPPLKLLTRPPGDWRCHYNKIHNRRYTFAYLRNFAPSEPKEEWDDRNRMYCIYFNIIYSVNHMSQGTAVRQTAFDDMYYLIDKYAPVEEGDGPRRLTQDERASLSAERDHTVG